ncbi:hypothetical protein [Sorangium sp. So ce1024]|uniref:hypothetical protein n=1 Tax=unclassified Sorangium TaxID=2621164 RepID=UPI003F099718
MSSDPDRDDPRQDLKQGLSLLWRAARKTAVDLRKDLDRTSVGKVIDDAGRELVRAATNVVGRIGAELSKPSSPTPPGPPTSTPPGPPEPPRDERPEGGAEPEAPTTRSAGPTPQDPGFRIAVDPEDRDDKPR